MILFLQFRIGRRIENNDLLLLNTNVSRSHGVITEDGDHFMYKNVSSGDDIVDGAILQEGREIPIVNGMKVWFGTNPDMCYMFVMKRCTADDQAASTQANLDSLKQDIDSLNEEKDDTMEMMKENESLQRKVNDNISIKIKAKEKITESLGLCEQELEKFQQEKEDLLDSKEKLNLVMQNIELKIGNKSKELNNVIKDEDRKAKEKFEMDNKISEGKYAQKKEGMDNWRKSNEGTVGQKGKEAKLRKSEVYKGDWVSTKQHQ
ncbi:hypothetical protein QAD02_000781 [Eretmocerus hayati]|uniref:Uncharacterized protein n=1 Tax=Eretmocerus hayati TaxID=131215 RepID=A0ACC2NH10_9HYME|nr:hypothetical protein QAD02_000781 [Eretmocerus hayati]